MTDTLTEIEPSEDGGETDPDGEFHVTVIDGAGIVTSASFVPLMLPFLSVTVRYDPFQ